MRPTLRDVHPSQGPLKPMKRKPIQKPWTASTVPPNLKGWSEEMRARFAEVATRILKQTGDEEKAIRGGIAAAMKLKKSAIRKARHRKDLCMVCKDKPPTRDVLWAGGKARAWFCDGCFEKWEHRGSVIRQAYVDGTVPGRFRKVKQSPKEAKMKVKKSTLLKVDGELVTLGELAQAWLSKAERFTNAPWTSPESNLSAEDYYKVCLLHLGKPGTEPRKSDCKLPIRSTPGGPINRNALRAAAAALGGARGGVNAPAEARAAALARVRALMREAGMEVTEKGDTVEKEWQAQIIAKSSTEKQLAYGLILRPDEPDAQGDVYNSEEVEKACHWYGANSLGKADWLHEETLPRTHAVLVESWVAPVSFDWEGFEVKKGDWLGTMWVRDKERWEAVKKGEIQAFSIKGQGRRMAL